MGKVDLQSTFSRKIAVLRLVAEEMGYQVTLADGHVTSKTGHMKKSLHYERLAQDFCLFKDGKYLTRTEDYEPIGLIWEQMGGNWGGRFNDGNHFSMSYDSRK